MASTPAGRSYRAIRREVLEVTGEKAGEASRVLCRVDRVNLSESGSRQGRKREERSWKEVRKRSRKRKAKAAAAQLRCRRHASPGFRSISGPLSRPCAMFPPRRSRLRIPSDSASSEKTAKLSCVQACRSMVPLSKKTSPELLLPSPSIRPCETSLLPRPGRQRNVLELLRRELARSPRIAIAWRAVREGPIVGRRV